MGKATRCAIYVHIPFCRSKCLYCDFNSCAGREDELPAYVAALLAEIDAARRHEVSGITLYIGGGTPSLLPPDALAAIVARARVAFSLSPEAEVTLEANPGTVDQAYLVAARGAGVNRLSLGVQSFLDRDLAFLGRIHSAREAVAAVEAARAAGFANLNLDLIYALPGQDAKAWQTNLAQAVALRPEHLSLYALQVEERTPLAALVAAGAVEPPSDDQAAALHELADDYLEQAGYEHYEVSNWARKKDSGGKTYRSRHNLAYWTDVPYLGFGAGAHSYFGGFRFWNERDPAHYVVAIQQHGTAEQGRETIDSVRGAQDRLMLGLRLAEGVDLAEVVARYGIDVPSLCAAEIEELARLGVVTLKWRRLALTRRGRLLANDVLVRLLPRLLAV